MFKHVVVVGAGAVGCYYGGMLARAGVKVTLIARAPAVEAIKRDGLIMDTTRFNEAVPVEATTDMAAVADADLILLCVKTLDTVKVARECQAHMKPDAVMISMQNGVDNADRIEEELGLKVISAAVYVSASIPRPGVIKHLGRGDLVIGGPVPDATLKDIAALFEKADVPCVISATLSQEMWIKLVMNSAYNAVSALTNAKYGILLADPGMREIIKSVTDECIAVAKAKGIVIDAADMHGRIAKLGQAMPETLSSTQQDIARGKLTEIDSLNGYVAAQGKRYGIPTPLNTALHGLVRLRERAVVTPAAGTP